MSPRRAAMIPPSHLRNVRPRCFGVAIEPLHAGCNNLANGSEAVSGSKSALRQGVLMETTPPPRPWHPFFKSVALFTILLPTVTNGSNDSIYHVRIEVEPLSSTNLCGGQH